MAEFLIDAWPDGKVTMAFRNKEKYFIFTLTADEATKIGMLLVDRARLARIGDLPLDEEEAEEPDGASE